MALPSSYVHWHLFTELHDFFFVPVPIVVGISCVFPLLTTHGVFLSASSQVCPRRGGRRWMSPVPGGLRLALTFHEVFFFYWRLDAKVDWRTVCM